jgi:regulation of enolase protein 1 (concanavalin A-like superfamily)
MAFQIADLPLGFTWAVPPAEWIALPGGLTCAAPAKTDTFIHPTGDPATLNAPRLLAAAPDGDWQFIARVTVDLRETFDAGLLMVWINHTHWLKLCLERSPAGVPTVVTVACRGVADDANAWPLPESTVWLRLARLDGAYACHASPDGQRWDLVRHLALPGDEPWIGFGVQSPLGLGCTATFDNVRFAAQPLASLR